MAILKHHCRFVFALALLALWPVCAHAQDAARVRMQESKIKAGLVYNLIKYTSWPSDSVVVRKKRIVVCLLGGDPFAGSLDPLDGRTAQQYSIRIEHISHYTEALNCNVVIIYKRYAETLEETEQFFGGEPILTIGDTDGFARHAGIAEIAMKSDHRVHLTIHQSRMQKAGLTIDNRMMKLAKVIGVK